MTSWGAGYRCWPVRAWLWRGQLKPLGFMAGPDGGQRLAFWLGVVALGRALQPWVGDRPLRVGAEAYCSNAAFLTSLVAAKLTGISRLHTDAVGWAHPVPIVGKRPRGQPRKQGRVWKLAHLLGVEPVPARALVIDGKEKRVPVGWREG